MHGHDHSDHGGHAHGEGHDHARSHGQAGHSHVGHSQAGHTHGSSETRIGIAAVLTGVFMLAEVAGGLISGSLALIADAGHMLTDFAGLGLAWYGFRLARRPADWKRTYGYDRFSILAAFSNGFALFAIAAWIVVEALRRLQEPHAVLGGLMLWVAVAGLAVNVAAFAVLHGGDRDNLNMRAAALHVAGDLLGSLAAIAAALIILATGWMPIDPILSVLVAVIILRSAWYVVRDAGHILLEGTPTGFDHRLVAADIVRAVPGVIDIHHVHAWSINESRPMVTLHARIGDQMEAESVVAEIKQHLREKFGIAHATVEIERTACADTEPGCAGEC